MVWGPCGGVTPSGGCEVEPGRPCDFVADPVDYPKRAGGGSSWAAADRPVVVTDLHVRPRDPDSVVRVAEALRGTCDTVLVADHGARRGDFPPGYIAGQLVGMGIRPWVTLSCRDRNAAALEAECAALAALGVAGIHCVTGDWVPGPSPVFDLDSLRLVERAVLAGLPVSVAASPAAPPVEGRPRRLAAKARAGASVCFVNHCGGPAVVERFVAAARDAGADMGYIPCVPVISDPASAMSLAALPGLVLDGDVVTRVAGAGGDPAVGVRAAEAEALAMLAIPGVAGVNLSGPASTVSEAESAAMMARLGDRIRRHPLDRDRS